MVGCGHFEIEVEGQKSTFSLIITNMSMNISNFRSRRADYEYVYDMYDWVNYKWVKIEKPIIF